MPTVRTTMRPDLTVEVDDIEYRSLKRQGLILADVTHAPAPEAVPAVAPAAPAKKTSGPAGSKES
ncbi:hypothetical protein [Streptomyces ipomoeae]|uniref:hypothetical protein n=1 Tax=Streptomyces ipomoeae TaxID=103232 RepID=UPI0029ACF2B8|nr:hypothetical protein [Streptomyces ipomoeae]MDX2697253.1 hypothetical protein [Streptomyces ipomoeae]